MEYNLSEEQLHIVIAALSDSISDKNSEISSKDFFLEMLRERLRKQEKEIEELKDKLKTRRAKNPKSSIISLKKAQTISSQIEKRKPGRPKKVVK